MLAAEQSLPWPTGMGELDPSERLIVWALRRWVLGFGEGASNHWPIVGNEFTRRLGDVEGRAALSAFASLIGAIASHARRTIRHHRPCCPDLGPDELCLVVVIAACQAERRLLARHVAEWLIHGEGIAAALEAAGRLAELMRRHGLRLPDRERLARERRRPLEARSGKAGTKPIMKSRRGSGRDAIEGGGGVRANGSSSRRRRSE